MQTANLSELRKKLDQIDASLIALLAERFQVTNQVGLHKKAHALPAVDEMREAEQFERITSLAQVYGLDQAFLHGLFRLIIDKVVEDHKGLQEES
jgi:chorismate mutase